MSVYLEVVGLKIVNLCQVYSIKGFGFILGLQLQDYGLLINSLLVITVIVMIFLLFIMAMSLKTLKESATGNKQKGTVWINHKLYDFDAEQLKILIRKINSRQK